MTPHFLDLSGFPAAIETLHQGGDPLVANPTDPMHRTMNYPRVWLYLFSAAGITRGSVPRVALLFCAFYLACISFLIVQTSHVVDATIGVTEGLWLDEPDVDATTWLNGKVKGVHYTGPDLFVLDQSTWSPVNTQNTSVIRELIPAFIFVTMACPVPGGVLDRYGDIWGGYFLLALMQGTKYHAAFGRPLVYHRRNPHNYVDDLRHEYWGVILTDWLLQLLRNSFKPSSHDILDRLPELAEFLDAEGVTQLPGWCPPEIAKFLRSTAENLRQWSLACRQVGV
jgi:hypothetical protein